MATATVPSQDCFDLIKEAEGLERKLAGGNIGAYLDPVGIPTIGFGSIFNIDENRPVAIGDIISRADALRWLDVEVSKVVNRVNELCKVDLTQGMLDALVSFSYNVGTEKDGLKTSTLLRKLNLSDYDGAAREFDRWIHGDGKVLPGLVIRRNKEEALFRRDGFPGDDSENPVPSVTSITKAFEKVKVPLEITRTLELNSVGDDCYILNCALAELGFLATGTQPNNFTSVTQDAVNWFQSKNNLKVDGKFGPSTKRLLSTKLTNYRKRAPDPIDGHAYCRLTRTVSVDSNGLQILLLEFISGQGNVVDKLENIISGAPGHQIFRLPEDPDSFPGNLEPIPQGRYTIGDIQWAGGKDNYTIAHAHPTNGLGLVFVPFIKTFVDDRDAFGFHVDWNASTSPGSAGCVCVKTISELQKLVALLRLYDPRDLYVDWDLR